MDPQAVVVAGDDLLFSTEIASALAKLGYRPVIAQTPTEFHGALLKSPAAAILNLASRRFDAVAAVRQAKAHAATCGIPILGFCGHADTARQDAARAAGCDRVVTNGMIAAQLPALLTLLAVPESSAAKPRSGRVH